MTGNCRAGDAVGIGGPGGVANDAVDLALDASSGLPAASGNSLTLTGSFAIAINAASEDPSLTQPQDDAAKPAGGVQGQHQW